MISNRRMGLWIEPFLFSFWNFVKMCSYMNIYENMVCCLLPSSTRNGTLINCVDWRVLTQKKGTNNITDVIHSWWNLNLNRPCIFSKVPFHGFPLRFVFTFVITGCAIPHRFYSEQSGGSFQTYQLCFYYVAGISEATSPQILKMTVTKAAAQLT